MIINYFLMIIVLVMDVLCMKAIRELDRLKMQSNVKIIRFSNAAWIILTVVLMLILWFGDFMYRMGAPTLILFIIYSVVVLLIWGEYSSWFEHIIVYDENGFSLGYFKRQLKCYSYENVTDIMALSPHFAIIINDIKLDSREHRKELKDFKEFIIKKRKESLEPIPRKEPEINRHLKKSHIIGIVVESIIGIVYVIMALVRGDKHSVVMIALYLFLFYVVILGVNISKKNKWNIRCEVCCDGILIRKSTNPWMHIPWEEIQQVCICYEDFSGSRYYLDYRTSVICFMKKGAKRDFFGKWTTDNSSKDVIGIKYSEQFYEEVKEKCPYPITDLRKSRIYASNGHSELYPD